MTALLINFSYLGTYASLLGGMCILLIVGMLDDLLDIRALYKLTAQVLVATIMVLVKRVGSSSTWIDIRGGGRQNRTWSVFDSVHHRLRRISDQRDQHVGRPGWAGRRYRNVHSADAGAAGLVEWRADIAGGGLPGCLPPRCSVF